MRQTGTAIQRAAIGSALIWALMSAGCKTTVQTHPPFEERIERMQEQVLQMESKANAERNEPDRPVGEEVLQ